jgi:aquaporin Z
MIVSLGRRRLSAVLRRETGMNLSPKRLVAEAFGTAVLVFVAVGVATITFGFGAVGQSPAAGIVLTAFAFGLVLMGLAYAIGPVSGCHINPAVTLGFVAAGRMAVPEALAYMGAQFVGGIAGAWGLWAMFQGSPNYDTQRTGLGTNGYGEHSLIGLNLTGVFVAEVVMTGLFVFIVLSATTKYAAPAVAGLVVGLTLGLVHLLGIALDGTSVNPARSLGPALVVRGDALDQVWVFIVAPLVGGIIAAALWLIFDMGEPEDDDGIEEIDVLVVEET